MIGGTRFVQFLPNSELRLSEFALCHLCVGCREGLAVCTSAMCFSKCQEHIQLCYNLSHFLCFSFVCLFVWRRVKGHARGEKGTYKYGDDSTAPPDISHAATAHCGRRGPNCGGVVTTQGHVFWN